MRSFPERSISFSPHSSSSLCTASEIAGWVRRSLVAAREKLFSVATVRKTWREWSSMPPLIITAANTGCENYKFAKSHQYRDNLNVSDRVYIFDTTLRDGE